MKSQHGIIPILISDRKSYWKKHGKAVLTSLLLIALGIVMLATLEEI